MNYQRIVSTTDPDIPYLVSILKSPKISPYLAVDENTFWQYVTTTENVFYFKVFNTGRLVGAAHCELTDNTLYMSVMVVPQYQRKGIASKILEDIRSKKLLHGFDTIEVSIDETNAASIALFEKMGFEYVSQEGELKTYIFKIDR